MPKVFLTEDVVRTNAGQILNFIETNEVIAGVGQLTTFNHLGFNGINKKPDGWYLPKDISCPAIILEAKNSNENLDDQRWIDELIRNCKIVNEKYKNVIGILYNGYDVRCYKNLIKIDVIDELQDKDYYLSYFKKEKIDRNLIFNLTAKINTSLHFNFGIKNLYHRMIFTACSLVAERYDANLSGIKDRGFDIFRNVIINTLSKALEKDLEQNKKLALMLEMYSKIEMNSTDNQTAINDFIDCVIKISKSINSDNWNGEDVMGIFFNEFNRYKKKSENGQVFTPEHITSFMYQLIDINKNDVILDAACGSGGFLVKAMCNMIKESGGLQTKKAKEILKKQLYGIEWDKEIYALACANMLIHKDGKTNITQMDSRTQEACSWIQDKGITKVLMNPPFENKHGCMKIVENVLDSVPRNTLCAFILPEKKLEKIGKKTPERLLKNHRLEKIIKLPEKTFNEGVTTSIFVFRAKIPQNDKKIFACYFENDGLERVKNQGRQDVKGTWESIQKEWIEIITTQTGSDNIQWLDPKEHLSYQMPIPEFRIFSSDFNEMILNDMYRENKLVAKEANSLLLQKILYQSTIKKDGGKITITIEDEPTKIDDESWKEFRMKEDLGFVNHHGNRLTKRCRVSGQIPFLTAGKENKGIKDYLGNESLKIYHNPITVDMFGYCFYHNYDCSGDDNIYFFVNDSLSDNVKSFIAASINSINKQKFAFVDQFRQDEVDCLTVKLPSKDGKPDFNRIEEIMQNIRREKSEEYCILMKQ